MRSKPLGFTIGLDKRGSSRTVEEILSILRALEDVPYGGFQRFREAHGITKEHIKWWRRSVRKGRLGGRALTKEELAGIPRSGAEAFRVRPARPAADPEDQRIDLVQGLLFRLEAIRAEALGEPLEGQYRVLAALEEQGPMPIGVLTRLVDLGQSTMSEKADRFAARGLLIKRRSTENERIVYVELTSQGRRELAKIRRRLARAYEGLNERLSPAERAAFAISLRRLVELLRSVAG